MAGAQSPENSPPANTPPSPSSSSDQDSSPPPPDSSSPPSPPSPDQSSPPPSSDNSSGGSSPSPPPPENSSGSSPSPPPPQQGSNGNNNNNNNGDDNNNNNDGDNGNNNNNNNGGGNNNNNNGNGDNDGDNNNNNNNGGNNNGNNNNNNGNGNNNSDNGNNNGKDYSPPPPSKSSPERGSSSPPKSLSPPKSSGGSSSSRGNNGLDMPQIIGIVAGAGLLLLVMILFCVCCCRKKKKKKSNFDHLPYYGGNGGSGQYYSGLSPQQHHYNSQGDYLVNMQPPPPPPGQWPQKSSRQHTPVSGTVDNSSEVSSNYSGPYGPALPPPHPSVALGFNKSTFTYDELATATQGFSQARLLGQGGFGYVHKGVLPNGKEIAVKSLKAGSGQGEREFQAEVDIISRVHHRHLVSLVGYCIAGEQRMLVYEFLPNNTLEFHLHGKSGAVMDWSTRLKIALGSAKGLAYLHEDCHPRIIHRDIKGANILLDYNFEAKVADFGLAKLSQENHTHVSTRVMGTFGYLAPEYASSGKLTDKSDVFSFGVMLLELVTGRRPVDLTGEMEDSLVDWARPLCLKAAEDGEYGELADPKLESRYAPHEMARMVACAAAAIRHSARRRPKMSQIVRTLEGDASLEDLNEGIKPGQSGMYGSSGGEGSSDYEGKASYSADMRRFRQVALDDDSSGQYSMGPSFSASVEMHRDGGNTANATPRRL